MSFAASFSCWLVSGFASTVNAPKTTSRASTWLWAMDLPPHRALPMLKAPLYTLNPNPWFRPQLPKIAKCSCLLPIMKQKYQSSTPPISPAEVNTVTCTFHSITLIIQHLQSAGSGLHTKQCRSWKLEIVVSVCKWVWSWILKSCFWH